MIVFEDIVVIPPYDYLGPCGSTMQTSSVPIAVNSENPVAFDVPNDFYGADCAFSVVEYPVIFDKPAAVPVIITQQLKFTSPQSGSRIQRLNSLPILVIAGSTGLRKPIDVVYECKQSSSSTTVDISGVETAVPFQFEYTEDYFGECELQTDAIDQYLVNDKVTFLIQNELKFLIRPNYLVDGEDFLLEF